MSGTRQPLTTNEKPYVNPDETSNSCALLSVSAYAAMTTCQR